MDEQQKMIEALNRKADELGLREPGLFQKARNLAIATTRHIAHGLPTVPDEERDRRLAICAGCEFYTPTGTCLKCGCAMKRKASWALERCPVGKWAETKETPAT